MKPIARRELARLGGVTQAAITKATQPGAPLADAVLSRGRGLDLDHPKVQAWLKRRHAAATSTPAAPDSAQPAPTQPRHAAPVLGGDRLRQAVREMDGAEMPDGWQHLTLDEVAAMPIEELVRRFDHIDSVKGWLDAAKKAADTRAVDLRNMETQGQVVSREMVRTHVFGAMEASHVRLLGDTPKSITRRVYAMARAGEDVEQAEKVVREMISSQLKPAMAAAKKAVPG